MNWKTGLLRVWAVGAVIWVVAAGIVHDAPYHLQYAYEFNHQYDKLTREGANISCGFRNGINEYDKLLQVPEPVTPTEGGAHYFTEAEIRVLAARERAAKMREDERIQLAGQLCVAEFRPAPPTWKWLAPVLLPPTLGVVIAGLLLWIVFVVLRWILRGFRSS